MIESKYLNKFKTLFKELGPSAVLCGDALLVELLEEPEITTASGIIIARGENQMNDTETHKATVGLVLAIGQGYYDPKTKETTPLDVPVGAMVMIPRYSMVELSTFPGLAGITGNKLGLVAEKEVNFWYKDVEAYERARGVLNG